MPAYTYEAIDAQGQTQRGMLQADSVRAARHLLRAQALVPLQVDPIQSASPTPAGLGHWQRRVFTSTALTSWTRQLAGLVSAGLPLERALSLLADESDEPAQRQLSASLRAEVNAGLPLAQALMQHPAEFSAVYTAVVAAGEHSGALGNVLERLADDLDERQTLKAKLIGAALYPAIVSVIALLIVLFLMSYVVPQIAQVFTGTQRPLPLLTVALLGLSGFLRSYGMGLLLALLAGGMGLLLLLRNEARRLHWDAACLRLPVIGRLLRAYHAARFAAILALLNASGVPILKALQAAANTLGNLALRRDAEQALVLVREGAPLASALAQQQRFPGLLAMFARLGEQTGQLPQMLQRAAQQMGNDVQRRAMHLATLLEPLLIVTMGLVVMLIVLAVLLPIIQMNQWVR